jgi:hypothetical protein
MDDDRTAIQDVLVHFCYLIDTGQPARIPREVFTHDAVFDFAVAVVEGREQLAAFMTAGLAPYQAQIHSISNVYVKVDGDTARSRCYVTNWNWTKEAMGDGSVRPADFVAVAAYDDTFVRTDDGWRISARKYRPAGRGVLLTEGPPMAGAGFEALIETPQVEVTTL